MPKWRERACTTCGQVMLTASKSEACLTCFVKIKKGSAIETEKTIIESYGYEVVGEPVTNKFGKRVYQLIPSCCGTQWGTVFGNLLSGIKKNEASGYEQLLCGTCGPKNRMAVALAGYVEKKGVDYDEATFKQYKRQVHGLSDKTYLNNKELLNPNGYRRGLAGQDGVYHLDHITPIIECFKQGWTAEQAADVSNLQMLEWTENLSKGSVFL